MKKLINQPEDFVRESLAGMAVAHADLIKVNYEPAFIYRADAPVRGKVAIISGGGSGHEPMHTGFVGMGMLDAACPGEVFTSPTPDQMLAAAQQVDGGAGIIYIVKNYSGDLMNFEMATELARGEGIRTLNIMIDDDVAVKDSLYTQGRRGVGTTVLAEKICGAAAAQGYDLRQVADLCRRVNLHGRSVGVALSSCTVPAKGTPTFALADNEIELGIGIHGEPGRARVSMKSGDEITEILVASLIDDLPYGRTVREWNEVTDGWVDVELLNKPLQKGDRILAFVNSMGGTPISELYIVYRKLAEICEMAGLQIVRSLIGPYITSLEMQGCSITLLKLDDEMLRLWDAPVKTPSLRWGV
ncbi:dihydroxyacetone kinase subunit DhaK [Anabaena cylindrica FACHB-243]|uniref:phosphoenolpyruvate--glycerone phosphotransferase n=1 Tax=Anabaena cylindrica (strain ATCC 27899 / PCC 7122) TaxID=272123 RepID=K9ZNV9_ANACC|nr:MULTISPECIES: dihydroxyacetone kinase subunit DhaK [Anabaena]AFZ60933.1 dihydroxyacetone kinase DhaK subunit [Anabaena cylindrica PCC 7122]MBD2420447.1 dihydroxyacetone kinase subunit DhaK [Anabaena cylindrica FACHB-243]MBY5282375.1 dihydroxyacetone kinase subunit DhaK [Anabaena sp. CCAP 1446/1C]MBY5306301.1 dihydroxyacetone kinase subunit DhaK [Anabaena sp. CCAP 1446/1C]MCM2406927.1 dihydroxyacetone kinase subunit DhaK [Anabaena sp. CCAP 1446/1C]